MANINRVSQYEKLYRVIKRSKPDCITLSGKVSPALFKDANGVSVDRDCGRTEAQVIDFIINVTFVQRAKAIGEIDSSFCFDIGADVVPAPSDIDPFHANIWLDSESEEIRNIQALKLADNCNIVYRNDNIDWTVSL